MVGDGTPPRGPVEITGVEAAATVVTAEMKCDDAEDRRKLEMRWLGEGRDAGDRDARPNVEKTTGNSQREDARGRRGSNRCRRNRKKGRTKKVRGNGRGSGRWELARRVNGGETDTQREGG